MYTAQTIKNSAITIYDTRFLFFTASTITAISANRSTTGAYWLDIENNQLGIINRLEVVVEVDHRRRHLALSGLSLLRLYLVWLGRIALICLILCFYL
jgi:hypothetical protein